MNRRALLVLALVAAGGIFAFALLMASSPAAVPAQKATATRPAPKPAATKTPSAIAAPMTPLWKPANSEWLRNARKGVAFELGADKKVAIWQGQVQPMLVVRCESNRMQAFVYTASAIQMEVEDENHTVRIVLDDAPERVERWPDSSDHDALFAPDAAAFARELMQARTLRFGYTPHNAARAVAEFQIGGLAALIEPAAKQCGLKK